MTNFKNIARENIKEHNPNWSQIGPNHPCRILTIGGSRSGKLNALFNVISQQRDIDKIYLYAKDSDEVKYQLLNNKQEGTGLKYCKESEAFIE